MRVRKWLRGAVRAGEMLLLCAVLLWLGGVRDAGHDLGGTTGGLGALSAGTCPGEGASLSGCVQRPTLYAVLPDGREWTPPAMHACPRWIDGRDRWARLLLLSSLRTMRADLRRGGRHASGHCDRQAVARSTQLLCWKCRCRRHAFLRVFRTAGSRWACRPIVSLYATASCGWSHCLHVQQLEDTMSKFKGNEGAIFALVILVVMALLIVYKMIAGW